MRNIRYVYTLLVAGLLLLSAVRGQSPLDKTLPFEFHQDRMDKVLQTISVTGNFYFSYSSGLIKKDSLVTLSSKNMTLRQLLDTLFHHSLEYKVNGNYIILRRASPPTGTIMPRADPEDKRYIVSGVILDENTGETIRQASVYDKHGLIATLTNDDGSFTVRLRNRSGPASLTVSKEFYEDTTVRVEPGVNQKITITVAPSSMNKKMVTISPNGYQPSDSIRIELDGDPVYMRKDPIRVEMTAWGRLLLSSRQKIQSINLRKYFIQQPFQLSLVPGLSTQGILSPQIINKISLNIVGGYTAGLKGVELGGVINLDKGKVQGVQAAGICNLVGGPVKGIQLAGSHNIVMDSVSGLQAAGVGNFNKGKLKGVQLAGVMNKVSDSMEGMQAAGIINIAQGRVNGVQLAGVVNRARKLKGVQIGLINIADSSDGYSIGLLNIVRKGIHEISFYADEISPLNLAFRSGNYKLYTIFLAGINPSDDHRSYYYGFGLGHRFRLNKTLSLNSEISSQHLAGGQWDNFKYTNFLNKLNVDLRVRLGKYCSLSAGPSLAIYSFDKTLTVRGHEFSPVRDSYPTWHISDKVTGWIGWRASINFL